MIEEYLTIFGGLFFLLVGICGCIYGLNPSDKYEIYRKSDEHYNDEDCT